MAYVRDYAHKYQYNSQLRQTYRNGELKEPSLNQSIQSLIMHICSPFFLWRSQIPSEHPFRSQRQTVLMILIRLCYLVH